MWFMANKVVIQRVVREHKGEIVNPVLGWVVCGLQKARCMALRSGTT